MAAPVPGFDQSCDPLGETLHFLRMSGVFYCNSNFSAPWGLEMPPMEHCMILHLVTQGSFFLETADEPAIEIRTGELLLMPHGKGHRMADAPARPCKPLFDLPVQRMSDRYEILRHGGGGDHTQVLCAAVRFEHPNASHLLNVLPSRIVLDAQQPAEPWIKAILDLIAAEAIAIKPGGETVMTRLADVLVIHAIRQWIASTTAAESGWLAALRDQQIGTSLMQIHREPQRDWTVERLAQEAGMSRSAFAAKFTQMVGETAMRYVTRWRMNIAKSRLHQEDVSLAELAEDLGYRSEAAFCRAFKKHTGLTPGAARKQDRASMAS